MKTFKEILEKKINQKDYKFYVVITGGKDAGKKAVGKIHRWKGCREKGSWQN
jgi:hypothetical protein